MGDCEYACLLVLFYIVLSSCCSGFSMSLSDVLSVLGFLYFYNVLRRLFLMLWI